MDLNNNTQKVVVVEGYHDLATLKRIFPNLDVVITNGSEISTKTLEELKDLQAKRGLILFLDPDYQGERIRKIINDVVGPTDHAFLPKEKCISKNRRKVGIEHAKRQDIIAALHNIKQSAKQINRVSFNELYKLGLLGTNNAAKRRKVLTDNLGIGLCNGKTLVQKLNMFGYAIEDVIKALGGN